MELKELLGEELYKQVQERLDAVNANEPDKLKHVRYEDLSEGNYVSKAKYSILEAEKANLEGQINTLNNTITTLQKGNKDNEELQKTITTLKADLDKRNAEIEQIGKTFALKEHLSKAGVIDPDYMIYKMGGVDKFTFDKENKPIGIDDAIKPYKEDVTMAHLFKNDKPANYRPQNGKNTGANPFAKESFNLTEQGRLLRENPAQARELAAAAGIII